LKEVTRQDVWTTASILNWEEWAI
jgi:hypothetical protein